MRTQTQADLTAKIEAITFDWYGTLAANRQKVGRVELFSQYLASHGLQAIEWNRAVLYAAFDYYGDAYKPNLTDGEKRAFWIEFTRLLFQRARVCGCSHDEITLHAAAVQDIFGSACFELYSDVAPVLSALKRRGIRLAVVSNWPRGLDSFCHEMNLSHFFDFIISSAEIGIEKPDPRIFTKAVHLLRVDPGRTLHVGDSVDEDVAGAVGAGLRAILIDRGNVCERVENKITSLHALEALFAAWHLNRNHSG